MLLTFALVALLLITIAGTFGTLVDSAIRAFNAYPALRDAARSSHMLVAETRRVEQIELAPLPHVRPSNPARASRIGKAHCPARSRVIVAA